MLYYSVDIMNTIYVYVYINNFTYTYLLTLFHEKQQTFDLLSSFGKPRNLGHNSPSPNIQLLCQSRSKSHVQGLTVSQSVGSQPVEFPWLPDIVTYMDGWFFVIFM